MQVALLTSMVLALLTLLAQRTAGLWMPSGWPPFLKSSRVTDALFGVMFLTQGVWLATRSNADKLGLVIAGGVICMGLLYLFGQIKRAPNREAEQ